MHCILRSARGHVVLNVHIVLIYFNEKIRYTLGGKEIQGAIKHLSK